MAIVTVYDNTQLPADGNYDPIIKHFFKFALTVSGMDSCVNGTDQ